jgi:hypothetical protein
MKIALALVILTGAIAEEAYRSMRHPVRVYELDRCHWHSGGEESCNHILAELREGWGKERWRMTP